jgi:hypothetical protein
MFKLKENVVFYLLIQLLSVRKDRIGNSNVFSNLTLNSILKYYPSKLIRLPNTLKITGSNKKNYFFFIYLNRIYV